MTLLLPIALGAMALAVIVFMAVGYLTGKRDLLSIRNYFLLGFVVFQLTSAVFPILNENYGNYSLADVSATALKFTAWAAIFLVVMLYAYRKGWVVTKLAQKTPTPSASVGGMGLLTMAFALTLVAIPLRLAVNIPLVASLANYVGVGCAAAACGMLGWVWGPRLLQPVMLFPAVPILLINAANVVTGTFGRRTLVALGAGLLWGMYFSRWRYLRPWGVMWRLGAVSVVPAIAIILFTSARASSEHERTAFQHLQAIKEIGNLGEGARMILDGQATGATSMWLMENIPENFEYDHMAMVQYFFYYPVPRSMWEDKPSPLSAKIADMSRRRNVDRDRLTIGPGILGHAAADGGWYALFVYAVVTGLFLRYFDEITLANPANALAVVPIGSALGQTLGLARGETSAFAFIMVFTVVSLYVIMLALSYVLRSTGLVAGGGGTLDWPDELGEEDPYAASGGALPAA